MWCNGSTLICNARDVGSIPALGTVFSIFHFHLTHDTGAMNRILYKLCTVWLLNLPYVCICKVIACMYVIVSIKRLTSPEGRV